MQTQKMTDSNPLNAYTPEQIEAWCRLVIQHTAWSLRRKYRRWARDLLVRTAGNDEEWSMAATVDPSSQVAFHWVEWKIVFSTVLTPKEHCVIDALYQSGRSQRGTARTCGISQASVSRVHRRACEKLREVLIE